MPMRGENWRFWFPVVLLLLFAGYSSAHQEMNPERVEGSVMVFFPPALSLSRRSFPFSMA